MIVVAEEEAMVACLPACLLNDKISMSTEDMVKIEENDLSSLEQRVKEAKETGHQPTDLPTDQAISTSAISNRHKAPS